MCDVTLCRPFWQGASERRVRVAPAYTQPYWLSWGVLHHHARFTFTRGLLVACDPQTLRSIGPWPMTSDRGPLGVLPALGHCLDVVAGLVRM